MSDAEHTAPVEEPEASDRLDPRHVFVSLGLLLLALLGGGAVMVLELSAPRLAAPHVGTTALTWTVVIGTFLAGIAIGNTVGGRLADQGRQWTLAALFAASSLATWLTPTLHDLAMAWTQRWPHGGRVATAVPLAFLPVAVALGTLTPVIARSVLRFGSGLGRRLGLVAAAAAAGSVAGTFLAGFVLVPTWGTRAIFGVMAGLLAVAAVGALFLERPGKRRTVRPPEAGEAAPYRMWALLAGLAGAAILAMEIAAGRLVAANLGNSLYTWTSVIGVVLTGLTVGGWLGGFLADRYAPRTLLCALCLAASIAVTLGLWGPVVLDRAEDLAMDGGWSWGLATLAGTAGAFLLPSIVLGTLSPVIIRAALADPRADGRIVGGLYAAGTVGAVAAAVGVGYWVVPWLGYEKLLLLIAFALAVASGWLRGRQPYPWFGVLVLLVVAVQAPFELARDVGEAVKLYESGTELMREDSRYFRIRVQPTYERWVQLEGEVDLGRFRADTRVEKNLIWEPETNRVGWDVRGKTGEMTILQRAALRTAMETEADEKAIDRLWGLTRHDRRMLTLDRLIHGFVDLQDPTWLGYDYERLYASVIQHEWPEDHPARCLFIGGGAFAFQRRMLSMEGDDFRCVTVEIDPEVTAAARLCLGLDDDPRHEIVHDDARTWIARLPEKDARFDFVFGDAFDDLSVPFHLTTVEFAEIVESRMTPSGIYMLNVIDTFASGKFLGALIGTLEKVFKRVRLLSVTPRRDLVRDTYVIVASNRHLSLNDLRLGDRAFEGALLYDRIDRSTLKRRAGRLILTDDFAPVENLLAPVVSERSR